MEQAAFFISFKQRKLWKDEKSDCLNGDKYRKNVFKVEYTTSIQVESGICL